MHHHAAIGHTLFGRTTAARNNVQSVFHTALNCQAAMSGVAAMSGMAAKSPSKEAIADCQGGLQMRYSVARCLHYCVTLRQQTNMVRKLVSSNTPCSSPQQRLSQELAEPVVIFLLTITSSIISYSCHCKSLQQA